MLRIADLGGDTATEPPGLSRKQGGVRVAKPAEATALKGTNIPRDTGAPSPHQGKERTRAALSRPKERTASLLPQELSPGANQEGPSARPA